MPVYCKTKKDAAQYAYDTILRLEKDWQWTMTIKPDTYEDYFASIVIDMLSVDGVKAMLKSSGEPSNTSTENTQAG